MENNNTTDIHLIIIRYLDGSAALEEKAALLQWLKCSEENRNDFTDTRDLWLSSYEAVAENELDIEIALERLRSRILKEYKRSQPPKRKWNSWYQAAAVLLVLLGMGYWFSSRFSPAEKVVTQYQLITAKGSKGRFTLPDGSIVWLNSESKLSYPESFRADKRLVTLEGEGYFEVAENKDKPFIVQAGLIDVEVLGTAFDISNYPSQNLLETVLLNGSVKISGERFGKDIILKPDQIFEYNRSTNKATISSTTARLHVDWIKDRLVFDNDRLSDILISMEGWYNLSIDCPKDFAEKTRMSFTIRGESIDEILKAMSLIVPIRYEITPDNVTIIPKNK